MLSCEWNLWKPRKGWYMFIVFVFFGSTLCFVLNTLTLAKDPRKECPQLGCPGCCCHGIGKVGGDFQFCCSCVFVWGLRIVALLLNGLVFGGCLVLLGYYGLKRCSECGNIRRDCCGRTCQGSTGSQSDQSTGEMSTLDMPFLPDDNADTQPPIPTKDDSNSQNLL